MFRVSPEATPNRHPFPESGASNDLNVALPLNPVQGDTRKILEIFVLRPNGESCHRLCSVDPHLGALGAARFQSVTGLELAMQAIELFLGKLYFVKELLSKYRFQEGLAAQGIKVSSPRAQMLLHVLVMGD